MLRLLLILVVTLGSIGPLNAGIVTYTVTPNAGEFSYQFTLWNTGPAGGSLFDLFLSLHANINAIDTSAIGTPVGWGDPAGGLLFFGTDVDPSTSFIEWAADSSATYDLDVGNSLSGFSFNSSQQIGQPIAFALNGSMDFATAQEVTATPEPSTLRLMIAVALLIGIRVASSGPCKERRGHQRLDVFRKGERRVNRFIFSLVFVLGLVSPLSCQVWLPLGPTGPLPSGRLEQTTVYDQATNTLIMYGGGDTTPNPLSDVWTLSNANGLGGIPAWTQLAVNPGPAGRRGHVAAYDPATNRMIVFGGTTHTISNAADAWVLTNANGQGGPATWVQLFPSGSPPSGRRYLQGFYDAPSNRMLLFGGEITGTATTNEVWILTNANGIGNPSWIQLSPAGPAPNPRAQYAGSYDPVSRSLMIFGGSQFYPYTQTENDYWVLSNANGLGGTPTWTRIFQNGSAGSPQARIYSSLAYDSTSNHAILFFGCSGACIGTTNEYSDVWILANANATDPQPSEWLQGSTPGMKPVPREFGPSYAYDAQSDRVMTFGGGDHPFMNDSWVLTNASGRAAALTLQQVYPNHGGNAGKVTPTLIGSGFQAGATVKLVGTGPDVLGEGISVSAPGALIATFDLTGAAPGIRNVVVTNPDNTTFTQVAGFAVEQGGASNLRVDIIGNNQIRIGRQQTFYITVGNSGNLDVRGVAVWIAGIPLEGSLTYVGKVVDATGAAATITSVIRNHCCPRRTVL